MIKTRPLMIQLLPTSLALFICSLFLYRSPQCFVFQPVWPSFGSLSTSFSSYFACFSFCLCMCACVCVGGGKFLQSLPLSFLAWLRFLKAFISSLLHIDQCPVLLVLMVPVNFFPQHLLQFHYIFSYVIIWLMSISSLNRKC